MNYKDFSTVASPVGAAIFNSMLSVAFFFGSLSGWNKLVMEYKKHLELAPV